MAGRGPTCERDSAGGREVPGRGVLGRLVDGSSPSSRGRVGALTAGMRKTPSREPRAEPTLPRVPVPSGGFGRLSPAPRRAHLGGVLAGVDEFQVHSGGQCPAFRCAAGAVVLRDDAQFHGVGGADPQGCGAAPYGIAVPLGGARVGRVVVVCLDVLPAGPAGAAGGPGTDLGAAVEHGGRVVPDDADQRERGDAVGGQALAAGCRAAVGRPQGRSREGAGAAGDAVGGGLCGGRAGRAGGGGGGVFRAWSLRRAGRAREGEGGGARHGDRGSKNGTHGEIVNE
ncbi:hypothetical protein SRIMM317S_04587 [Streptomyces rimosus subsp. rimosus]